MRAVITVKMRPKRKEPISTPRKKTKEWRKAVGSKMCPASIRVYVVMALEET